MRWGHGFFRVWIILSVIYVLIVGLFSYEGVAYPWHSEQAFAFRASPEDFRADYPELTGAELNDAIYREHYSDLTRDDFDARLQRKKVGPDILDEYDAQFRHFETGVARGDLKKLPVKGVPRMFLFVRAITPSDKVEQRLAQVQPMAAALQKTLISEKRAAALTGALLAAAIPPVVVLLLGWAMGWAIAGFRRNLPPAGGSTSNY